MSNSAAFLASEKAWPLEVMETPSYKPGAGEVLVENRAIAINPIDGLLQAAAPFPIQYPSILGNDVAGTVVEVGPGVTRFKAGDRVAGQAIGLRTQQHAHGGFQSQTVVVENLLTGIPDDLDFEDAAVFPLGLSTAACGLFQEAPFCQLHYPTEPAQPPNGKVVLIWGGSSSVGSNGIQAARAAGYVVIATASPHNFGYIKNLGAESAHDYNSPTIAADLLRAIGDREIAGALDCIGGQALQVVVDVLHQAQGKGTIATTKGGVEPPAGITVGRIFGTALKDNAVGKAIYEEWLPKAFAASTFVPSPKAEVVGKGLENVQAAVDIIRKGVSAKKLVVTL